MFKTILTFLFFISLYSSLLCQEQEINPNGYNIFYFPGGTKSSEGHFENGVPVGYWKNYYENGQLKSEGNRVNAQLDSLWRFYREDGALLQEIEYKFGQKNGFVLSYNEEGLLESKVPYSNDTINGKAFYYNTETQRLSLEKSFVNNKEEGNAYEYANDGRVITIVVYEKGFVKDRQLINRKDPQNRKTGRWLEFYDDEEDKIVRIEGRFKDDLKHGYFREYDKKGLTLSTVKYEYGQIVENVEELMKVDIERSFHPNAAVKWEKTFLAGQPHGVWKEFNDTGAIVNSKIYTNGILLGEGVVDESGKKQGFWKEFYTDGKLRAEGEYLDGGRIKAWKFYHPNGEVEQNGSYVKGGLPHGKWMWYYPKKSIRRIENFRNGKEDGDIVEYDTLGNEILKGYFVDGLEDGEWVLDMGDYREVGSFIEGLKQGEWKHYYISSNKLRFKGNFVEGFADGKHTFYYESGKKMLEGKYQMGDKQGEWKRYNEDGLLFLTIDYKDGRDNKLDGRKIKPETDE